MIYSIPHRTAEQDTNIPRKVPNPYARKVDIVERIFNVLPLNILIDRKNLASKPTDNKKAASPIIKAETEIHICLIVSFSIKTARNCPNDIPKIAKENPNNANIIQPVCDFDSINVNSL